MADEVISELERRMAAFADQGDPAMILDDSTADLARVLAPDGRLPADVAVGGVVARLRFYRYLARPRIDPSEDVAAALAYLRTWGVSDPDAALASLRPLRGVGGVGVGGASIGPCNPWQIHLRGAILAQHACVTGDPQVLDRAIDELRAALVATAADHPNRTAILSDLGGALRSRYELAGSSADLDEAVAFNEEAVEFAPADSPYRSAQQVNLHSALIRRFERRGDRHDLEEAIRHGREAVADITDVRNRAMALANLGVTLRVSFNYTARDTDGRDAIRVGEQAVTLTSTGDPRYATHLSNLSVSWLAWGVVTGHPADLDRAVRFGRQAVDAASDGNPDLGLCRANLGNTLRTRYERLGTPEDLTEAVCMCRAAVDAATPGDPHLPLLIANLGIAMRAVADGADDAVAADVALRSYRDVVRRLPPHHVAVAGNLSSLGEALRMRFARDGDLKDLRQAIEVSAEAVRLAAPNDPRRPGFLSNLSLALCERARVSTRFRAISDLIAASRLAVEAIAATPALAPESAQLRANFAGIMAARYERTHRRRYATAAVDELRAAASITTAPAAVRVRAARAWAELAASRDPSSEQAVDAATAAVELLPLLAWRGIGRTGQERRLAEAQGIGSDAAAFTTAAARPAEAVVLVEQARAVLWTQLLDTRTELSALRRTAPGVAARLTELRILLNASSKGAAQ